MKKKIKTISVYLVVYILILFIIFNVNFFYTKIKSDIAFKKMMAKIDNNVSSEVEKIYRKVFDMDRPFYKTYFKSMTNSLSLNFGISLVDQKEVRPKLIQRLPLFCLYYLLPLFLGMVITLLLSRFSSINFIQFKKTSGILRIMSYSFIIIPVIIFILYKIDIDVLLSILGNSFAMFYFVKISLFIIFFILPIMINIYFVSNGKYKDSKMPFIKNKIYLILCFFSIFCFNMVYESNGYSSLWISSHTKKDFFVSYGVVNFILYLLVLFLLIFDVYYIFISKIKKEATMD